MPRTELTLSRRTGLRRQLLVTACLRGVRPCDADEVLDRVDDTLQRDDLLWKWEPPRESDIAAMAGYVLRCEIANYHRRHRPEELEATRPEHDPPASGLSPLDQLIHAEDVARAGDLARAEEKDRDDLNRRREAALEKALDPRQRCYSGASGSGLLDYDRRLASLRRQRPSTSLRQFGRELREFYRSQHPELPFGHRHETFACERWLRVQERIEDLLDGK